MAQFIKRVGAAAAAAVAGAFMSAAMPTPASAQFFFFGAPFHRPYPVYRPLPVYRQPYYNPYAHQPPVMQDEELTPREIMSAVQRLGFRNPSRPVYGDETAVVTATGRDGRKLRLSVDIYSGRVINTAPVRQQLAQRAPEQGAAIRRALPDSRRDVRAAPESAAPERPAPSVRREPVAPQQPRQAAPPKAQPPAQPPSAAAQPGTRTQPRRIEMTPPAALDDVRPAPAPAPAGPPINSVPPAGLE